MNHIHSCLLSLSAYAALSCATAPLFAQVSSLFEPTPIDSTATWNDTGNWDSGFIPDRSFNERAVINGGGTAFVDGALPSNPAAVLLGDTSMGSGNLEVRDQGTLNVEVGIPVQAGDTPWNGGVTVGGAGVGTLDVQPGGILITAGPLVSGANPANGVTIGGASGSTATVTVGSATFNAATHIFPNAAFTSIGSITFGSASNYTAEIDGASSPQLNATDAANLNGALHVNFAGAPSVGSSWPLIEAASINGGFSSLSSNAALSSGQNLYVSTTPLGGGGERLDLNFREVLVLRIDRNTGTGVLIQPGSSTIDLDGYSILSSQGTLLTNTWNSMTDQGALGGGWSESNPSATNLSELKSVGAGSLASGQDVSLGKMYDPLTVPFGFTGEDLSVEFTTPGGEILPGLVEFSGTLVNNLVLQVDPNTGEARILNRSGTSVDIEAYYISSESDSLTSSTWNSFDDQDVNGGDDWLEILSAGDGQVGEVASLTSTTMGSGGLSARSLGNLFDTTGTKDLSFQYLEAGGFFGSVGEVIYEPIDDPVGPDFNLNGVVDGKDFLIWQSGFGIASGATVYDGDADGDGDVDSADLGIWQAQLGAVSTAATTSIPEPVSFVLLGACAVVLVARPSRHIIFKEI